MQPPAVKATAFEASHGVGSNLLDSLTKGADSDHDDDDNADDDDDANAAAAEGGDGVPLREVAIDIHDDDDLGDDRIDPSQLRSLLRASPALANLLYDCAVDEGLLDTGNGEAVEAEFADALEEKEGDEPSFVAEADEE